MSGVAPTRAKDPRNKRRERSSSIMARSNRYGRGNAWSQPSECPRHVAGRPEPGDFSSKLISVEGAGALLRAASFESMLLCCYVHMGHEMSPMRLKCPQGERCVSDPTQALAGRAQGRCGDRSAHMRERKLVRRRRLPGGPGWFPTQGSHRSGRARLAHPAPREYGFATRARRPGTASVAEAGIVSVGARKGPTSCEPCASGDPAAVARPGPPRIEAFPGRGSCRGCRSRRHVPGAASRGVHAARRSDGADSVDTIPRCDASSW